MTSLSSVFWYATPGLTTAASNDCSPLSPTGVNAPSSGVHPRGGPPCSPGAAPVPPVISSASVGSTTFGASDPIFTIVAVPSKSSTEKSVSMDNLSSSSSMKSSSSVSITVSFSNDSNSSRSSSSISNSSSKPKSSKSSKAACSSSDNSPPSSSLTNASIASASSSVSSS